MATTTDNNSAACEACEASTAKTNAKYVTAATFDPKRLVFGEFESKGVRSGEANFESIGIKYRYSDAPDDEGSVLKWATPVMVSPRGFSTRNINGKTEWSFMVVFSPDEDPDWDEDTLKLMASDPVYKQRKEEEWTKRVAASKLLLDEEIEALGALSDAVIKHIETLKESKKSAKLKKYPCISGFSGNAFSRLPYAKDPAEPHYTAWLKLMDIPAAVTANGKPALANVAWPDGELIPKSAPKDSQCFTWNDLVEKHLTVEALFTIRGVFFGKVNKLQTSAVSVLVHSVRAPEAFDPLATKAKVVMADKDKAQAVARNKTRLLALKKEPAATSTTNDDGEKPAPANMAEEDDVDEEPRRPAAAPKRPAGVSQKSDGRPAPNSAGAKRDTAAPRAKETATTTAKAGAAAGKGPTAPPKGSGRSAVEVPQAGRGTPAGDSDEGDLTNGEAAVFDEENS